MPNTPRQLHFVPCFHLRGFTLERSESSRLHVYDRDREAWWESTPRKAAKQRDLYRLADGVQLGSTGEPVDPLFLEDSLGGLEDTAKRVIDKLEKSRSIPPPGPELNALLNYVALLVARVPVSLGLIEETIANDVTRGFLADLRTPEGWTKIRGYLKESGIENGDDLRSQMIELIESGDADVSPDHTSILVQMQRVVQFLLPLLALREWSICAVAKDAPDLVCSDCPVGLTWHEGTAAEDPPMFWSPGACLSVPLSRRMALMSWLGEGLDEQVTLSEQAVAALNAATVARAQQVYAATDSFVLLAPDRSLCMIARPGQDDMAR